MCESEEKRSGVSEVEVVFALPTTAAGDARPDPHAQVFAFLPVKAYGFRWAAHFGIHVLEQGRQHGVT
jgi:hypothetical protein